MRPNIGRVEIDAMDFYRESIESTDSWIWKTQTCGTIEYKTKSKKGVLGVLEKENGEQEHARSLYAQNETCWRTMQYSDNRLSS